MGYELCITRQAHWFDENEELKISIDEWKNFLAKDLSMRLDNFAEVKTNLGNNLRMELEGLAVWTKYSGDGLKDNHAWFSYDDGNISVKNPDQEIMAKMLDIADQLNAKLQGEEGEVYMRSAGKIIMKEEIDDENKYSGNKKHWWKFW